MTAEIKRIIAAGREIDARTSTAAVDHLQLGVTLDAVVNEYNVSALFPTSGTSGSNKYTLVEAITLLSSKLSSVEKVVGSKIVFIDGSGVVQIYSFNGDSSTYGEVSNWVSTNPTDINIVQSTGSGTASVMSQDAVSKELIKKLDTSTYTAGMALKADTSIVTAIDTRLGAAETEIDTLQSTITTKANTTTVTALDTKITTLEGELNATKVTVASKADSSNVYVKSEVDLALSKKADASTVTAIDTRLGTVETEIDTLQSTITTKADASTVTAIDTRLGTIETDIDTLQSTITTKADQSTVNNIELEVENLISDKLDTIIFNRDAVKTVEQVLSPEQQDQVKSNLNIVNTTVVQETGGSTTSVMSQNAITTEISSILFNIDSKASSTDVESIDTRLGTAETDIDNVQTGLNNKLNSSEIFRGTQAEYDADPNKDNYLIALIIEG